jgi:hypothetical protein
VVFVSHDVTPAEFEQAMNADPLDLGYEVVDGEDRYRSVGVTNRRAVTAFPAGISNKKTFLERSR